MSKIRPNFDLREFVPPSLYNQFGEKSRWFLDERMLDLAQFYRDWFDAPVTVNNWHRGGNYTERGFRMPDSDTGASLSQHRMGRAIDFTIRGVPPDNIKKTTLNNEKKFFKVGVRAMESKEFADTWTHIDCRNTNSNSIMVFTP